MCSTKLGTRLSQHLVDAEPGGEEGMPCSEGLHLLVYRWRGAAVLGQDAAAARVQLSRCALKVIAECQQRSIHADCHF